MLTILCGEDSVSSRRQLQLLLDEYRKSNHLIEYISPSQIMDVYKDSNGVVSLFGQQKVYVINNLSSTYSKRSKAELAKIIEELASNKDITLLDWEEGKSAYELSSLKKIASQFKEFKPEKSIFQLMDSCFPGNKKDFISNLQKVNITQEETFIFIMLSRHMRSLLLAKYNGLDSKVSPWQKRNLLNQSKLWEEQKLIGFYEGLARIDIAMKTSNTPFKMKESLDILACYYL